MCPTQFNDERHNQIEVTVLALTVHTVRGVVYLYIKRRWSQIMCVHCQIPVSDTVMYVSKQKPHLEAAKVRRFDASPRFCLGCNVITSKLRYNIIIHNFHLFIFCIYVYKTKLHQFIKQRF